MHGEDERGHEHHRDQDSGHDRPEGLPALGNVVPARRPPTQRPLHVVPAHQAPRRLHAPIPTGDPASHVPCEPSMAMQASGQLTPPCGTRRPARCRSAPSSKPRSLVGRSPLADRSNTGRLERHSWSSRRTSRPSRSRSCTSRITSVYRPLSARAKPLSPSATMSIAKPSALNAEPEMSGPAARPRRSGFAPPNPVHAQRSGSHIALRFDKPCAQPGLAWVPHTHQGSGEPSSHDLGDHGVPA